MRELLVKAADSQEVSDALDGEARELFDLFGDDADWWHLVYGLLNRTQRLWITALQAHCPAGSGRTHHTVELVPALLEDEQALAELGTELLRDYAGAVIRRAVQIVRLETIDQPQPHVAEAGHALASFLGQRGVFHDPEAPGEYEGVMYGATYRALSATATAIQVETSKTLAHNYVASDSGFVPRLALEVAQRMTEMLADEAGAGNGVGAAALAADGASNDPKELCFDWVARKAVHAELGRLLAPLGPRLLEYMTEVADTSQKTGCPLGEGFWDSFAKTFSVTTRQAMYVPWHSVEEDRLERVVDRLFARLGGSETVYLVIFRVGNLNPRNLGWRMGSVTFYDPAVFDYGGGRFFRSSTDANSYVHVAVRISANTQVEARSRARGWLEVALSCLSFSLSVRMRHSGYRPEVLRDVFVLDPFECNFLFGREHYLDVSHTLHYADASGVPKLARAYDRLLTHSANQESLNELQESFLKAVRWYREARWEEDPAKRFALYWISLEHIFAGGGRQKAARVFSDIPELQMTWRNLGPALLPLSWSLQEVRGKIKGDETLTAQVDEHADLKDWRSDERILLDREKVKLLIDLTPSEETETEKVFRDYLKQLEEVASYSSDIGEDVARLRDRQWFKLYLIYALRNKMFHEAVYENKRLPYLADEIADIADGVLPKVVEEVTSPAPECTTVEQLIERFGRQPWEAEPAPLDSS